MAAPAVPSTMYQIQPWWRVGSSAWCETHLNVFAGLQSLQPVWHHLYLLHPYMASKSDSLVAGFLPESVLAGCRTHLWMWGGATPFVSMIWILTVAIPLSSFCHNKTLRILNYILIPHELIGYIRLYHILWNMQVHNVSIYYNIIAYPISKIISNDYITTMIVSTIYPPSLFWYPR